MATAPNRVKEIFLEAAELPDEAARAAFLDRSCGDDAGLRGATGAELVDGQKVPTGGDVIVEFDGQAISSPTALQSAVDARRPGETVSVVVLRSGDRTRSPARRA